MKIVYLIESIPDPSRRYVGITSDLQARLIKHNEGGAKFTAPFRPWRVVSYVTFTDEQAATAFEKYMKTGSGRAFANRNLW